jgi:multidrug efflux pump subunit AcrA (membrane-fusion protein)
LGAQNALTSQENLAKLLESRRARLESARDLVGTQLDKAKLDLARTQIVAPIDGVVVEDLVEVDSFVQRGTPLVKLEDTSAVEVECNLLLEELNWIWKRAAENSQAIPTASGYELPPTPVTVAFSLEGQEYTWQGVLARFDGVGIDPMTRTAACRVVVEKPQQVHTASAATAGRSAGPPALLRNMFVTVRIHIDSSTPLLQLPEFAVRPGARAWRVRDGRLEIRQIQIARREEDSVLFHPSEDGLQAGDRIVISPLATAFEGMAVSEQQAPADEEAEAGAAENQADEQDAEIVIEGATL